MELDTGQHGVIQIDPDKIIDMPSGMPGFPGRKRFVILEQEEIHPFLWYQCVDDPSLAFVIVNPFLFEPEYSINFKPVINEMDWADDGNESIRLYVVVNAADNNPQKTTANLLGPLLINVEKSEAVQRVFPESGYSHKHPIFA